MSFPGKATIDLGAVAHNVAVSLEHARGGQVMAIVKANGYGHGAVRCGRAALAAGATWLGAAQLTEAVSVRREIPQARMFAWLYQPDDDLRAATELGVDLSAGSAAQLQQIAAARGEVLPRVHLKVDSGLGRNGCPIDQWEDFVATAATLVADGKIAPTGVWTHMAFADAPKHPSVASQHRVFAQAVEYARGHGFAPEFAHLSNSAATFTDTASFTELIRPGLAVYGLSPIPDIASASELGLRPAMRLTARVGVVKDVPAGQGVSYGLTYRTQAATRLALIPLGYADGIPRHAGNTADVYVAGERRRIAGRVCMDQFMIDLAGIQAAVGVGDEVVLFGDGSDGEPTAEDWAQAAGTISYEIVTRIGSSVPRVYVNDPTEKA